MTSPIERPAEPGRRETRQAEGAALSGRIAVSGADGFIGRRFIELYGPRFEAVSALVRTLPVSRVPQVDYRICDLEEAHSVRFAVRGCDRFVHFAYDVRNPHAAVPAIENVVSACEAEGVARLVHLSTVAVYDQTRVERLDETSPRARYRDPYIESKIRTETALDARWRAGFRKTVILQPTVVYGEGSSWSHLAFRSCRIGRVELPMAGAGRCNCVFVDDVCQAVFRALTVEIDGARPGPPRYIVNGPDTVSWRRFFESHGEVIHKRGLAERPVFSAPPTRRRFADGLGKNLAMATAFRPLPARVLYEALRFRPNRPAPTRGRDKMLAALLDPDDRDAERFVGMGRLYTATACRADHALAERELGYTPEFDLRRGTERLDEALRALMPRLETRRPPGAFVDLEREAPPERMRHRVCIIGTGIGGGALASSLLRREDDVVVIEAGNRGGGDDKVGLDVAGREFGLAIYRDISVGGTGNAWRGQCAPFDDVDFVRRDWIPESGWPFLYPELDPYYREAASLLRLDDYGLFFDQSTIANGPARVDDIRIDRSDFTLKYFLQRRPPKSFGPDLLAATRKDGGPLLLQNAPALELVTDRAGTRIEQVLVKDGSGRVHPVEADVFVVSAGALETPRLLLNSRQGGRVGIGNEHDLVGRYLMDHPMVGTSQVHLQRPRTAPLYDVLPLGRSTSIKAGVTMREDAQRRHRLPNHAAFFLPSLHEGFDDAYERARRSLITARRKRLSLSDVATVLRNPNTIQWALSQVSPLPALFRYADLFFVAEQTPTATSRVDLSERRDRHGYPMARVHWEVSDDDIDSLTRFNELLLAAFPRKEYEVTYLKDRWEIAQGTTSRAHFCGTARMGTDPRHSVLDPDLKVWNVDNLYVCDASVFPTAGNANPSLTIATLAVRLAEHLTRKEPVSFLERAGGTRRGGGSPGR